MPRLHVPLQITCPRERLVAQLTLKTHGFDIVVHIDVHIRHGRGVRLCRLQMESHMLVEVAGIAEWTQAELALQRLKSGMGAYVYLQAVFAGIDLAAVDA